MNLKRLQAFRAVYQLGSVTKASQQLNTTQPAVSRLIRDLEEELGLRLFARQHQRLSPTVEGRVFYREAQRALAAVDQIADIARDIRTLQGAHLRVVTSMAAAFGIVPAASKTLLLRYPNARISLEIKDVRDIADWIATGPFDVGMSFMPLEDPRIECELLVKARYTLVVPKTHRLARKRSVKLKDLKGERMVLPSIGILARDELRAAFASVGLPYFGVVDTPSALSACQFVALGLGLAIVDPFTARAALGFDLAILPISPAVEISFGLFYPANRPRSTLVKAFGEATRSFVGSFL
jgi:DNA-binding transcriptional LysR family regulator